MSNIKVIFKGGQSDVLRDEFREKERYKRLVSPPGRSLDTLYERYFYGRVNHLHESVQLVPDVSILAPITAEESGIKCLNFVQRAFNFFKKDYIQRLSQSNRQYPKFLTGVVPTLGHEDFEILYDSYFKTNIVNYSYIMQDSDFLNFNDFLSRLDDIFLYSLGSHPITRSGFLLSKHSPVASTGLVIELANLPYDSDEEKGEILQSADFECYCDSVTAAGFMIDKNAPWRLYADLDSEIMTHLVRNTNLPDEDAPVTGMSAYQAMDAVYWLKTHRDDLYDFQDFAFRVYNEILEASPKSKSGFRPTLEESNSNLMIPESWWLERLVRIRML